MTGKDSLPWALDTLQLGGQIRDYFIRLQDWVKAQMGEKEKKGR